MKIGFQRSKKRGEAVVITAILLLMVCIAPAAAIGVTGSVYKGDIPAGGTATHVMYITNSDTKAVDVQLEVMDFVQNPDQSYAAVDQANQYSARDYITLDKKVVRIEPKDSATVTATIKVPQTAGAGGIYAMIYVHTLPQAGEAISTAVNVPIMIQVPGTATQTGTLTNVTTGELVSGQPIVIISTLQNTGNTHYYHTVNAVKLTDSGGNVLFESSTSPSIFAILPGSVVEYRQTPNITELKEDTYTIKSAVSLENGQVLDEKTSTFEVKKAYIPPVTESSISLSPGSQATLTSPDGRYSVTFPQGSVLGDAVVSLKPYSKNRLQPAPAGAKQGATCFEITGLTGLLGKNATVKVMYSADDLAAANGDASKLKLAYFDAAQGSWVILPTKVDTGSTTLSTTTNHLSVWAVMISSSTTGTTVSGATAEAVPTESPLPLTVVLFSVLIAVVIIGNGVRKRK